MDLHEALNNIQKCLGPEKEEEYTAVLRQWLSFSSHMTKDEFEQKVRKLLTTTEEIRHHINLMRAVLCKINGGKIKSLKAPMENSNTFEYAEYSEYVQQKNLTSAPPSDVEYRSAAAELFMPDSGFVASRIAVSAWENGMAGAKEDVTEVIVYACQMFIKNIITAMLSRKKGYKIRDGKFQYGFNQPIPDPFIRNYANVIDDTLESKVEVADEDDSFMPKYKNSLENMEQQVAFAYSCSKRQKTDNVLTVQLLYDTLRDNPKILGLHTMQSVSLLKLGLQMDD